MASRGRGRGRGGLGFQHNGPPIVPQEQPAEAPEAPEKTAQEKSNGNAEAGKDFSQPPASPFAGPAPVAPRGGGGRGRGARGGGFVRQDAGPQPPAQQPAENESAQKQPPQQQSARPVSGGRGGARGGRGGGGFRGQGGASNEGQAGEQDAPHTSPQGQEKSGRECHKCREEGHIARECPNKEQGEKRPFTGECHICQQTGHIARECPDKPSPKPAICYRCDQTGHLGRDCPDKPERKPLTCYNCGKEGHGKRDCSEKPAGSRANEYVPTERNIGEIFEDDDKARESYSQITEQDDELKVLKANGTQIETVAKLDKWQEMELDDALRANIDRSNYTIPRKIQAFTIPIIMEGRDLIAQSETGSGKSAAFLVPMIQKIKPKVGDKNLIEAERPYAIVIEPTRELVFQVHEQARKLAHGTGVRVVKAYGEYSFDENCKEVFRGCDLLIATPGRLLHFITTHVVNMSFLEHLVLDEADRLLDANFGRDVAQIMSCIQESVPADKQDTRPPLQVMLFSATMPDRLEAFGRNVLRDDHVIVRNDRHSRPNMRIVQTFQSVAGADKKHLMLDHFRRVLDEYEQRQQARAAAQQAANPPPAEDLNSSVNSDAEAVAKADEQKKKAVETAAFELPRILVFCGSKAKADVFAFYVNNLKIPGMLALSVNGDRSQPEREVALSAFRQGNISILFATDVCARGLDIKELNHVLNFDMPKDIPSYVQRIGRTGRLRQGFAHSFLDPNEDEDITRALVRMLQADNLPVPACMQPAPAFQPPPAPMRPLGVVGFAPVQAPTRPFGNVEPQPAGPPAAAFVRDPEVEAPRPPSFSDDEDEPEGPAGFGQ